MILPIVAYGHPVLKKKCQEILESNEEVGQLILNMWETMYNAEGVGLAGPQVGKALRIFLVDTVQVMEKGKKDQGIKQVFINAQMQDQFGEPWTYEEGCLSIPNVRGDVERLSQIKITYLNENFEEVTESYEGINARVIQHEYDHIEGKLFTEMLKPLKKRMIKRKLEKIAKGQIPEDYRMKFYV